MDHRSTGRLFCSQIFKNTHQEEPHHEKEHHTALTTALLAAVMCVSMAACGSKTDDTKTDGTGDAGGVILGAGIYYIVYQVITFAGFDTDLLKMFSAVVVAVFLGAPHVKAQLKAHSRSKKGDSGHAENE